MTNTIKIPVEVFEMLKILKSRFIIILIAGLSFSYFSYYSQISVKNSSHSLILLGSYYQKPYEDNWDYTFHLLKNKVICPNIVSEYAITKESRLLKVTSYDLNLVKFTDCILAYLKTEELAESNKFNIYLNEITEGSKHNLDLMATLIDAKKHQRNYHETKLIEALNTTANTISISYLKLAYNFFFGIIISLFILYSLQVLRKKS